MTAQTVEFGAQLVTFWTEGDSFEERDTMSHHRNYYQRHREVDVDAQVKVWDALERETWRHKSRVPGFAVGASIGFGPDRVAKAYEREMGRSWDEVDAAPEPESFGGPAYPSHVYEMTPACTEKFERARIGRRYGAMRRDFVVSDAERERLLAEYHATREAWDASEGHRLYLEARDRWATRRAQFAYTGSRKGDKELLASLVTVAVDENQAVLA